MSLRPPSLAKRRRLISAAEGVASNAAGAAGAAATVQWITPPGFAANWCYTEAATAFPSARPGFVTLMGLIRDPEAWAAKAAAMPARKKSGAVSVGRVRWGPKTLKKDPERALVLYLASLLARAGFRFDVEVLRTILNEGSDGAYDYLPLEAALVDEPPQDREQTAPAASAIWVDVSDVSTRRTERPTQVAIGASSAFAAAKAKKALESGLGGACAFDLLPHDETLAELDDGFSLRAVHGFASAASLPPRRDASLGGHQPILDEGHPASTAVKYWLLGAGGAGVIAMCLLTFMNAECSDPGPTIQQFEVLAEHRRRGIGTRLLQAIKADLAARLPLTYPVAMPLMVTHVVGDGYEFWPARGFEENGIFDELVLHVPTAGGYHVPFTVMEMPDGVGYDSTVMAVSPKHVYLSADDMHWYPGSASDEYASDDSDENDEGRGRTAFRPRRGYIAISQVRRSDRAFVRYLEVPFGAFDMVFLASPPRLLVRRAEDVFLVDLKTGHARQVLLDIGAEIRGCFPADGHNQAVAFSLESVVLFDLRIAKKAKALEPPKDGRMRHVRERLRAKEGCKDGIVSRIEAGAGKRIDRAAHSSGRVAMLCADEAVGQIHLDVHDLASGQRISSAKLSMSERPVGRVLGHRSVSDSVSLIMDGRFVVVHAGDGEFTVLRVSSGAVVFRLRDPLPPDDWEEDEGVPWTPCMCLSRLFLFAATDREYGIAVFSLETGQCLLKLGRHAWDRRLIPPWAYEEDGLITALQFDEASAMLYFTRFGNARLYSYDLTMFVRGHRQQQQE